ncbi:MAG: anti-sigma factor antagonist [Gammaproteobacteria bacterium]|nr:anti-sigma factor antagonist [Gammaproteobacteria bacterium]
MELRAERRAGTVILQPVGRIDHHTADGFNEALLPHLEACKAGGDRLLFVLSALEYISSAGLRVLMIATKRTKPAGGEIALATSRGSKPLAARHSGQSRRVQDWWR